MTFQLVPIVSAIRQELHVAFSLGRLTATLEAALVAYGAFWREHGCSRGETRRLLMELLSSCGYWPGAARRSHELGAQDVLGDIMTAAMRPYDHARWTTPPHGIVLAL